MLFNKNCQTWLLIGWQHRTLLGHELLRNFLAKIIYLTRIFKPGYWLAGSCAASQSEAMLKNSYEIRAKRYSQQKVKGRSFRRPSDRLRQLMATAMLRRHVTRMFLLIDNHLDLNMDFSE